MFRQNSGKLGMSALLTWETWSPSFQASGRLPGYKSMAQSCGTECHPPARQKEDRGLEQNWNDTVSSIKSLPTSDTLRTSINLLRVFSDKMVAERTADPLPRPLGNTWKQETVPLNLGWGEGLWMGNSPVFSKGILLKMCNSSRFQNLLNDASMSVMMSSNMETQLVFPSLSEQAAVKIILSGETKVHHAQNWCSWSPFEPDNRPAEHLTSLAIFHSCGHKSLGRFS